MYQNFIDPFYLLWEAAAACSSADDFAVAFVE